MENNNKEDIFDRKKSHIDICLKEVVNSSAETFFDKIILKNLSLPELNYDDIDIRRNLFDYHLSSPFFISCMVGGSDNAYKINKNFAIAAQKNNIAVGMGSIRIFIDNPQIFDDFHLRKFAPNVPLFANIGGAQVRDYGVDKILEATKKLEVDALVIHLNALQELVQKDGDKNFSGIKKAIFDLINKSGNLKIITKEVGFGINPIEVVELLNNGVSFVDIAGNGGTNWALVELFRNKDKNFEYYFNEFEDWGLPNYMILKSIPKALRKRVWVSGGIRKASDIIKSLCLGAHMCGIALPFLKVLNEKGLDGLNEYIEALVDMVKIEMLLIGASKLNELDENKLIIPKNLY